MPPDRRLPLVLCWHMHQPEYRDPSTGRWTQPWTYLHALKDYADMAAHLEAVPAARAVVNFSPVLLEQLDEYARQLAAFRAGGSPLHDVLLAALLDAAPPAEPASRIALAKACLRANRARIIERFPAYRRLTDIVESTLREPARGEYLSDRLLEDLVVWYHLGWLGECTRRSDPTVRAMLERSGGFTQRERGALFDLIHAIIASIVGRYRQLAERGQIELSVTPYSHPILPLLLDFAAARATQPQAPMPASAAYPGGLERAHWQIRMARETFARHFGQPPAGCWPAEGGVDAATLTLLGEHGFQWAATGGAVLHNSLGGAAPACGPYQSPGGITLFARNDELSDLIGFTYASWHADDAVANLEHRLLEIAARHPDPPLVAIIMDGENAWEYYPENAWYFLSALYRRLSDHPRIRLTTFGEAARAGKPLALPRVVPGSWVYGTFSTWIGMQDKNTAWDVLCEAKRCADEVLALPLPPARRAAIEQQLAVCEASDWFWWFGDYNPAQSVSDFEHLFRLQISRLYELLDRPPPAYLEQVLFRGSGAPEHGGVMRHGREPGT